MIVHLFYLRYPLRIRTVGLTGWISVCPRPTQTEMTQTCIYVPSGFRTHDPSVRALIDSTGLRPHRHCDLVY
jgi:hypothetical protein